MNGISKIITKHLKNVRNKIQRNMVSYGRNASGRTSASLMVKATDKEGTLLGSPSFFTLERGKRGGRIPRGFHAIIMDWIKAKGISFKPMPYKKGQGKYTPEERGLRTFAGAVANTIMKKGTKLYRDGSYNDIYSTAIEDEIGLLGNDIMFFNANKITEINKSFGDKKK